MGIESLLFKTEALDFVEVEAGFKGYDIVSGYSYYWFVGRVVCSVEGQRCLSWDYFDCRLLWLELPK